MALELDGSLILIVTTQSLVLQAPTTKLLRFSFLPGYAIDSFILVKFLLVRKILFLGLNVYFSWVGGLSFYYTELA